MAKPTRPIDPDLPINRFQLAELIGERQVGRPTHPNTVYLWMVTGLRGVKLASRVEALCRVTTWGEYEAWLKKIAARREEAREMRRAAVDRVMADLNRTRKAAQSAAS
jgi:hypothetical protein